MLDNKNNKSQDNFMALVNGGRTMGGVPLLKDMDPPKIERKVLMPKKTEPILFPQFDEKKEYENFLNELKVLRTKYKPFLENHSEKIKSKRKELFLNNFDFRMETEEDKKDFSLVLNGKGEWKKIKIPHYIGPDGKWNMFYRTTLNLDKKEDEKAYVLDFGAVDYIGEVYLNGRLVGSHTGFFAPFSVDLTQNIIEGENVLLIVVKNEISASGVGILGQFQYGNKVYAATHLGYDEPELGWHHCPSGAGIISKVKFVVSNIVRINDIWIRTNIDDGKITVNSMVYNYSNNIYNLKAFYTIEGRNFKQTIIKNVEGKKNREFFNSENYLSDSFSIPDFKLWTQDEPYLYQLTLTLKDENNNIVDIKQTHFGMRKFFMDINSEPKGKFYFNNERIILRGANEMGHLPRCVMEENYEQLIDDILIAKIANMNFYRLTQRPVFPEIYDYMDMLGMMCQTDFPMFGNSRYNLVGENLKQTAEMEILTRNHPCVVIESFCNETIDTVCWNSAQYRIDRYDLEKMFEAMRKVVEIHNPDRVVKHCDGDYSVLGDAYGIGDFHTYNLWYTSHTIPYGKLAKGYIPTMHKGWMTGCGEYGTDALDSYEVMQKYYPKEWLPKDINEPWSPKTIAKAQCYGGHGSFFPEQDYILDWIRESREWQRKATKMYVHALRRRVDLIESTAIHLLIDAWPAGWTKTLVDVDRIPKPGYYAFKEANIPVRISLRRDKYTVYEGDKTITEIYALNDTAKDSNVKIDATVYFNDEIYSTYSFDAVSNSTAPNYLGEIVESFDGEGKVKVVAKMLANGIETFDEVEYVVKKQMIKAKKMPLILSDKLECVKNVCQGDLDENIIFVDGDYYSAHKTELEKKAQDGARLIIFINKPLTVLEDKLDFRIHILADEVSATDMIYHNKASKFTEEFEQMEFAKFFNEKKDYMDLVEWFKFDWEGSEEIHYVFTDSADPKYALHKKHKMVTALKKYGKGEVIVSTISALDGCIGVNPVLDKFFINLIEK